MQLLTPHGVAALLIADNQEQVLLRYSTATDLGHLTELLDEFSTDYGDRDDVRLDITS